MRDFKALFIDDDDGIVEALNLYSEIRNVSLLAVRPEQAMSMVETYEPSVVFFDYLMPGQDGPTLLQNIRQNTPLKFKAVLVTAHPKIASRARDKFAGWIKKPFAFAELERHVNNKKRAEFGATPD